jgi:hypothetical protein
MRLLEFCLVASLVAVASGARAEVVEFTDAGQWAEAAGPFNTIGFAEFPDGTLITDQYAQLGALFTDANDFTLCCEDDPPDGADGAGLEGNTIIHLAFLTPQSSIAFQYPIDLRIQLFAGGTLIYTSSDFIGGDPPNFVGLVSNELFDAATLIDPYFFDTLIDDVYFGGPIDAGDLDGDGAVGVADLLLLLEAWGPCPEVPEPCPADVDHDGMVGVTDFLLLLSDWS